MKGKNASTQVNRLRQVIEQMEHDHRRICKEQWTRHALVEDGLRREVRQLRASAETDARRLSQELVQQSQNNARELLDVERSKIRNALMTYFPKLILAGTREAVESMGEFARAMSPWVDPVDLVPSTNETRESRRNRAKNLRSPGALADTLDQQGIT